MFPLTYGTSVMTKSDLISNSILGGGGGEGGRRREPK